ncbi:hypothetical protein MAC_00065 [Metarhizium acridum CQMa 102]|uniref:Uncharacterized protein n=1 Tax=Metarhizium acridum (strain CQMa 102) TaxID=655827 RepID=E9DRZ2_METAQ|nr:uncharacterized protein MAC_00065 [Metarhizium acridum CQMa 102]EFY93574.1 hypothetical protein MAC_00065 [Metarhizium acridum CQMa 102]
MSRRIYLETTASGKHQFVSIKRSRSHGHHHHHHHHVEHEYYKVSVEEWDSIKERERCLEDTNRSLAAEVSSLKASLTAAQGDAHNLRHVVVPQLQNQVHLLSRDNDSLRKSLDNASRNEEKHSRDAERLRQTIDKLEKEKKDIKDENHSLKDRVKHLQDELKSSCGRRTSDLIREIEYWRKECRYWKDRYEDTKRSHDDICITLDIRTEKMRAYEEILKRRRII